MLHRTALYGLDHTTYGAVHLVDAGPRIALALSVGAEADSPAHRFKADPAHPNEDALVALDDGERCLLAVADSHFGHHASHLIIAGLARLADIPPDPMALAAALDGIDDAINAASDVAPDGIDDDHSASTLCVAVFHRPSQRGFGLSIGDSTFAVVGPERLPVARNRHSRAYVHPGRDRRISRRAEAFRFTATPGDLLLAFTDGIDECHYRRPETSLRPEHLQAIFAEVGSDPARYARRLVQRALTGVEGNPGGQDNIALVVAGA